MIIEVVLVPAAQFRLEKIAKETGRTVENLVATAAEEAALEYFRGRNDYPCSSRLLEFYALYLNQTVAAREVDQLMIVELPGGFYKPRCPLAIPQMAEARRYIFKPVCQRCSLHEGKFISFLS